MVVGAQEGNQIIHGLLNQLASMTRQLVKISEQLAESKAINGKQADIVLNTYERAEASESQLAACREALEQVQGNLNDPEQQVPGTTATFINMVSTKMIGNALALTPDKAGERWKAMRTLADTTVRLADGHWFDGATLCGNGTQAGRFSKALDDYRDALDKLEEATNEN